MLPDATRIADILAKADVPPIELGETSLGLVGRVEPDRVYVALEALRDSDLDFSMLVDMFGIDTGEIVEVTYHLRSFSRDEEFFVKISVPYDGELRSVWNIYASALMPERETAELLGLRLAGHPNPKRLLTTDGVEPLLRKSVPIRTLEEVRAR